MAKIDVTQTLTELDGVTPLVFYEPPCQACGRLRSGKEALTLRLAITRALAYGWETPQNPTAKDAVKQMDLALRVQREDEPDLMDEDTLLIKKLLPQSWRVPLIVAQVARLLTI